MIIRLVNTNLDYNFISHDSFFIKLIIIKIYDIFFKKIKQMVKSN
jgi:hypothetical protein